MNEVDVIKSKEDINRIKELLLESNYRNYVLFVLGINTGLKISQLLALRFSDIFFEDDKMRDSIISEGKEYILGDNLKQILEKYKNQFEQDNIGEKYLFCSCRGNYPIERCQAYRIINEVCKKAGMKIKVGTHTLRKTYGYHYYRTHGDLTRLQHLFNHASKRVTLKYIGMLEEYEKDGKIISL